jgi:hypothetical protein
LSIVFRDHYLSDLIGFRYCRSPAEEAAQDFVNRIMRVRKRAPDNFPALVSVILDGENCWEFYKRDGHDFLDALYSRLSETKEIRCVTIGEYLKEHPPGESLKKIFPGSWINHNYRIWIGHEEDNTAWDLLNEARQDLVKSQQSGQLSEEAAAEAWEEIYIAEGSDWNWWYGDDHTSGQDELFDQLYRKHLVNLYRIIDKEPPARLLQPISAGGTKVCIEHPRSFVTPKIDGQITHYYEWQGAGEFDPMASGGAMHQVSRFFVALKFGFNMEEFFVLVNSMPSPGDLLDKEHWFELHFLLPRRLRLKIESGGECKLAEWTGEKWQGLNGSQRSAAGRILEVSIPWKLLNVEPNDDFQFRVQIHREDTLLESCPAEGAISLAAPDEDFEARMWFV